MRFRRRARHGTDSGSRNLLPSVLAATPLPSSSHAQPQHDAANGPYLITRALALNVSFSMAVHPGSDLISSTIRRNGVWEGALCRKILEHFDAAALDTPATLFTFVDVGANIGYHSLCVASHGFRTLSIEALDSNYGALARSVSLNGYESRMHTYHAAVAAAPAAAPACLRVKDASVSAHHNFGGGSLVDPDRHPVTPGWHAKETHRCHYVNVTTVDAIVARDASEATGPPICPLVLKLDVEGYELFALRGAANLLLRSPPCFLFLEFHAPLLIAAGVDPLDLLGLLRDSGFVLVSHSQHEVEEAAAHHGVLDLQLRQQSPVPASTGTLSCAAALARKCSHPGTPHDRGQGGSAEETERRDTSLSPSREARSVRRTRKRLLVLALFVFWALAFVCMCVRARDAQAWSQ